MVLNFQTQSNSPASPTRWWAMKGDLRDKSAIVAAEAPITGLAAIKTAAPATRSVTSRKPEARDVQTVACIICRDKENFLQFRV
jgi:hypothetical protein